MSYFDSAYIAKFYLDEPESDAVRRLAESLGRVHCSLFGRLEVASVFHGKWREGAFGAAAFREVSAQFSDDCGAGIWSWLPITAALIQSALQALERLPKSVFLRAGDALHLVSAREHGIGPLYSNDRHVLSAAKHLKVTALSV